jgi:predicted ATP-grasp superfamily ATP-dependent carboligase
VNSQSQTTSQAFFTGMMPAQAESKPTNAAASSPSIDDAAHPGNPPVLILGGEANALSVARDLGKMGVKVFALGEHNSATRHSRNCRWIDLPETNDGKFEAAWTKFLLGPDSDYLHGAVILACSDAGLTVLAKNRENLKSKFRLDDSNTTAQLAMLDKLTTYRLAREIGMPMPKFWEVHNRDDVLAIKGELVYPLLVKPRLSHVFENHFGKKFITVNAFDDLVAAYDISAGAGMDMLLVEVIPGGDEQLCSYYTYLDEHGNGLFHFTKAVIRRFPVGMGSGSYHITTWNPALPELGLKFFRHVGLRGLANIEFKQDPRDGQYKLIEVNARFTAANCLVSASGCNLARLVYNRITGRQYEPITSYRYPVRLWDPVRDFWAFRELRRRGQMSFLQWVRSVLHKQTFPYFRWTDPKPAIARTLKPLGRLFRARRNANGS